MRIDEREREIVTTRFRLILSEEALTLKQVGAAMGERKSGTERSSAGR